MDSQENDYHDWYSKKNLMRLWNGLRRGEAMVCHATDPQANDYGGKPAPKGHDRLCVGQLILIHRHLKLLERTASFAAYRNGAGKYPLTKEGLGRWVERILFGGLNGQVMRGDGIALPFDSIANKE